MTLSLFPAGNTSRHPADGTSGEVFPGSLCRELLLGGDEMEQEFDTLPERGEVGREQLMPITGDSGLLPAW